MLHLPGLKYANEIERMARAARDMRLAVRGLQGLGDAGQLQLLPQHLGAGLASEPSPHIAPSRPWACLQVTDEATRFVEGRTVPEGYIFVTGP